MANRYISGYYQESASRSLIFHHAVRSTIGSFCNIVSCALESSDRVLSTCTEVEEKKRACAVLYCTVLHCTVLYCTALYCTVLYCTVLYCTALHCTALHCTVLYCTVLYCTALYCTALHCTVLYCTVLYCTVLYCTVLYCTALHCTVLHCTALHCTVGMVPLRLSESCSNDSRWSELVMAWITLPSSLTLDCTKRLALQQDLDYIILPQNKMIVSALKLSTVGGVQQ